MTAKNGATKWLNIIIIVISALILAFMLLGKLMERDTALLTDHNSSFFNLNSQTEKNQLALTKIVYSAFTLRFDGQWRLNKTANIAPNLSLIRIEEMVSLWRLVLEQPTQKITGLTQPTTAFKAMPPFAVKLYFQSRSKPLVAKVLLLESKRGLITRIIFSELDQQVSLKAFYYKRLGAGIE